MFVRYGRDKLDDEIKAIFGDEEKNKDGSDKEITYGEYLTKINDRSLDIHLKAIEKKRKGKIEMPEDENEQ